MKTFYVYSGNTLSGKMATSKLRKVLVANGFVEAEDNSEAVYKFVYSEDIKVRRNQKGYIYFGFNSRKELVILKNRTAKLGPLFNLNFKKKQKLDKTIFSQYGAEKIGIKILNVLFGKSKEKLPNILPFDCVNDFIALERLKGVVERNNWTEGIKEYNKIVTKYNLTAREVSIIQKEVKLATSYKGKLLYILKQFKGYYKTYIYPNISDSIIVNLLNMCHYEQIATSSKSEETKAKYLQFARDEFAKAASTIRDSLFSKNGWKSYSKDSMKTEGIYSLFLPDDTLATGEMAIPKPTKRLVKKDQHYPAIGEKAVLLRQPTNTVFMECVVKYYTDDGSIRCNFETILAYYGDADGDALTVTWGKWMNGINVGNPNNIKEFNEVAKIKIEYNKYSNNFDVEYFKSLKPATLEEQLAKQKETGLEQAQAKLATKEFTGALGNIDMEVSLNLIRMGVEITPFMNWLIAELDQTGVQMKNIQKELAKGELADKFKETFRLISICSQNNLKAAELLSNLTKRSQTEMLALLRSLNSIDQNLKMIEESSNSNNDMLEDLYENI